MGRKAKATVLIGVVALMSLAAAVAHAELTEEGDLFVHFDGGIAPNALPREKPAPISVRVEGRIKTLSGERPPALREIKIELNSGGHLNSTGLPVCRYGQLVAASIAEALKTCGGALVGKGFYLAHTAFPEQATFPSQGRILAFNGVSNGHEAILAHIYGEDPVPITRIVTFDIGRISGTYGTVLTGELPVAVNRYGYVESISLLLFRRYVYRGQQRSYLTAACAAPPGFFGAVFPFARTSMTFADGSTLSSTLTRRCAVSRNS